MTKSLLIVAAMALSVQAVKAAEIVVAEVDFSKMESYDMYHSDHVTPVIQDGALYINNDTKMNFWDVQFNVLDDFSLVEGTEYTVTAKVKGFSGNLPISLGSWESSFGSELTFTNCDEWQTVSKNITSTVTADGAHLMFQSGEYTYPYWIESVTITCEEPDADTIEMVDAFINFSETPKLPDYKSDAISLKIENGALVVSNNDQKPWWELQYIGLNDIKITKGVKYTITTNIKGFSGSLLYNLGWWGQDNNGEFKLNASDEWQEVTSTVTSEYDIDNAFLLFMSDFVGTYEIEWIKVSHFEKAETPNPDEDNLVASFYTGNGKTFGGWGDNTTFENVTEDDKPCLKFTHTTNGEYYAAQIAIDRKSVV